MAIDIEKQISLVNKSLEWIKTFRPEHYDTRFLQLIECRKVLKTMLAASENNPGIAAFGKSQVGKSYLIGCLLQDKGKPFMVKTSNQEYDFVKMINPPSEEGGGRESTGVVSRFTSFKRNPSSYNIDYPVLVKLFSLTDIINILAEEYYNNFGNYKSPDPNDLEVLCTQFLENYSTKKPVNKPIITADDVLYMKDYFIRHINNAQTLNNTRVAFFDRLALIIENVPPTEYLSIFSFIWNNDSNISLLYNKLYNILRLFNFMRYIYLPIEAVLHNGVRENTIMSVQCLKQLFDTETKIVTDVYVKENERIIKRATGIPKSDICAVCSEVIFKIEEDFLSSTGKYALECIGEDVKPYLNQTEIQMSMLRDNDLLDFPGARAPENEKVDEMAKSVLLNGFLRGKVSYLFNKYNDEMGINILLYCHHNKDNDVTTLYQLLEEWVNNYVGTTPEERRKKLAITKVSPLFYIGTMFNIDMKQEETYSTEEAINQRWDGRFNTVVNMQCFHDKTVKWVHNWTKNGEDFHNSYVLRDYKFSDPDHNKLYDGFKEMRRETKMIMSKEHYEMMRKTFIDNQYVKQLFANPALSWDVAASMNNDGALYIMENLAIVAGRMDEAREVQFSETYSKIVNRVKDIMKEYFVSDDTTVLLAENIRKANAIFRELEFTCQSQPEYFGHLLQALQLTEAESFRELHQLIPTLASTVNDSSVIKDYELVRKRCNNFKDCKNEKEKWAYLISTYRFTDQKEAEEYLQRKGIDPENLFKEEVLKRKNSAVISNHLVTCWEKKISSVQFANSFSGKDCMDEIVMTYLITCLISTANNIELTQRIEAEIADYVNILNTANINESLIADMIATTISDFVIDFGYRYLAPDVIAKTKRISGEQHLSCFEWLEKERTERLDEDGITQLFNDILSSTYQYTPAYEASYNSWLNYLYIAFIAFINVPDYDHEANEKLKTILDELK